MAIYSFTFSPTRTSAKILQSIGSGLSAALSKEVVHRDLTYCQMDTAAFSQEDILLVAAPVYGGKIAPIVKQRLEGVSGCGAKCIVVAVYGNRAFENALNDLAAFMSGRGFNICGAAAFVGEHSYSTNANPIAQGRPDRQDIEDATEFGRLIAGKIIAGELSSVDVSALKDEPSPAQSLANFRDFVLSYQRQQSESPQVYLPEVDQLVCDGCGSCYDVCPTGAISADNPGTDPLKCIKCCACVKICPQSARSFYSPFAKTLSANFSQRKSPRWIL